MDFKDLSIFKKILVIIFFIFISPLLLFIGIMIITTIPFEYPKYKTSRYYKKYKEKYRFGITWCDSYKTINYFEKNNIKYDSFDSKEDSIKIGVTTYLFPWFEIISFNEDGDCIIAEENYDFELLKDSPKIQGKKNVKILTNERYFDKKYLTEGRNYKQLVLYNKISDLNNIDWE